MFPSKPRCPETGLSVSFAYKKGCRCFACKSNKAIYTARDTKAAERSRHWWHNNPIRRKYHAEKARKNSWLRRYSQYLTKQDNCCAVCGASQSTGLTSSTRLHMDHCHTTGVLRGLLCSHCNVGIGHFKDSPERLRKAAIYLEHYRGGSNDAP